MEAHKPDQVMSRLRQLFSAARPARSAAPGLRGLPLLRRVFADVSVKLVVRATDSRWAYEQVSPVPVSGFNPFRGELYLSEESALHRWLRHGGAHDRRFNKNDRLVTEALFLIHDYLHIWALRTINQEHPELMVGRGSLTRDTIETYAFCHLLTEAAATVGLDYWYLSTIDLDTLCRIGTDTRHLTVGYTESRRAEYSRFCAGFNAQEPEFFDTIARFYCSGVFPGFSARDLLQSAHLSRWLEHEVRYGRRQREYIRAWLAHLSNGAVMYTPAELGRPVRVASRWQRDLIDKLGRLLWEIVKTDAEVPPPARSPLTWKRDQSLPLDFRFTNLNAIELGEAVARCGLVDPQQHVLLMAQYVSSFPYHRFPARLSAIVRMLFERHDLANLVNLFESLKLRRLEAGAAEPFDLLLLN